MIDDAVDDEHGSVLVLVGVVSLAVETEDREAGRTVQHGVAVAHRLGLTTALGRILTESNIFNKNCIY